MVDTYNSPLSEIKWFFSQEVKKHNAKDVVRAGGATYKTSELQKHGIRVLVRVSQYHQIKWLASWSISDWSVCRWPGNSGSWSVCWPDRWHLVSWWARQVVVGCSIYCLPVILFTGPFAIGRSVWPLVSHFAFGHAIEWSFGWSGQLFALSSWRPEFELILWKDQHKVVKMSKICGCLFGWQFASPSIVFYFQIHVLLLRFPPEIFTLV